MLSSPTPPPPKPGWQNAPSLTKLTASQQGGSRGAQFWGVAYNGRLYSIYQESPGGPWSAWAADWAGPGNPGIFFELAAAQQNNGCVRFWALDMTLRVWSTAQVAPGGNWTPWSGPNWNNSPTGMKRVAAGQQGGSRGVELWGITKDYQLVSCYEETPGGVWTRWNPWLATPKRSQFIEVTAAQQNDGRLQLWALDTRMQLWACWQTSPGGDWTGWSGPDWASAPKLKNIAACQQGGSRGAQLWGITEHYQIVSIYQVSPGGNWSEWSTGNWANAPLAYELAVAQQNNGCVQLWAVTLDNVLTSIPQISPGGNWGNWS